MAGDESGVRFEQIYNILIAKSVSDSDVEREFQGNNSRPRKCRFCTKTEPEVSFRRDAHVIPAALGNRILLAYDECDICNDKGSEIEDDLCKRLSLERAIAARWSRGGNKLKFPSAASSVSNNHKANRVEIHNDARDDKVRTEDLDDNRFRLTVKVPAYKPMGVAKAICRMALYFVDTFKEPWDSVRRWIRDEIQLKPSVLQGFVRGTGMSHTILVVYKCVDPSTGFPPVVVQFGYGTAMFFVVPIYRDDADAERELLIPEPGISPWLPPTTKFIEKPFLVLDDKKRREEEVWVDIGYKDKFVGDTHRA